MKACPFCGSTNTRTTVHCIQLDNSILRSVGCVSCGASIVGSDDEARDRWNKRVTSFAQHAAAVQALRNLADEFCTVEMENNGYFQDYANKAADMLKQSQAAAPDNERAAVVQAIHDIAERTRFSKPRTYAYSCHAWAKLMDDEADKIERGEG